MLNTYFLIVLWISSTSAIVSDAPDGNCTTKRGLHGTCRSITECSTIQELLDNGDLSDLTSCANDGTVGIFCCPSSNSNVAESVLTRSCLNVLKMRQQLSPSLKAYNPTQSTVAIEDLPFMAQIISPEKGFIGAGALISERFVLTSAHIVFIRKLMPSVRLGKTNIDDNESFGGLNVKVKQVIPHEFYTPRESYYDIALLLLRRPVKFYTHIWPACLDNSKISLTDKETITLSGWRKNELSSSSMVKSDLKAITNLECQSSYNDNKFSISLSNEISDNLICANNSNCRDGADSDGPVYFYANETFFIYAMASSVDAHCESSRPGIYTKISSVLDWIESIVL